jgi:antiviral helicase SLH1
LIHAARVVYIGPMKALASEVTVKLGDCMGRLGLTVGELTGDISMTKVMSPI